MAKAKTIIWQQIWARRYAPFLGVSYLAIFNRKDPKFIACRNRRFVPEGGLHGYYFDQKEWQRLIVKFQNYLLKQDIKNFANRYEKVFHEMLAWSQKFSKKPFSKLSNQKLAVLIKKLSAQYRRYGEWQFMSFIALEGPVKEVESLVPDKEILQAITTPYKETKINRARIELLKLCSQGKISTQALNKYLKKYTWLPVYDFIDPPLTLSSLKNQLLPKEKARKEMDTYFYNRLEGLKAFKKYFVTIKDKRIKKLIAIAHYFSYLKEMRDDFRRPSYLAIRSFWEEIVKRTNLTFKETNYLIADELVDALKKPDLKFKELAQKRLQNFALELEGNKLKVYSGKEAELLAKDTINPKSGELIRGAVAYPGKITGTVKIIYHKEDFLKFNKGDILVTAMTHPEFLPIMRQAKAIITDEGGLTCHAAIVAREMKKPCIIGTKIATKVLKDGDKVEVDATKGVVRKIKSPS